MRGRIEMVESGGARRGESEEIELDVAQWEGGCK